MIYKNLFIDLDDTLWDFQKNSIICLEQIYHDYNFDSFYSSFRDYYDVYLPSNHNLWDLYRQGKINREELIVERILVPIRKFGISSHKYAKEISDDYLERTTRQTHLIDGAIELLTYLKPKYNMHILSNGFTEVQYKKIENSGLTSFFDKIILSEDAGINKPHPQIFNYALDQANASRADSLMIGDSLEADIEGAYNSNINQIWFNPNGDRINGINPTYVVKTLLEIKSIL